MYLIAWVILLAGLLCRGELLAQPVPPLHLHAHKEPVPRPVIAQGAAAVIRVDPIRQKTPSRALRRPLAARIPASVSSKGLDKVKLLIGDQFTGSFLGYKPDTGLQWRHPSIRRNLALNGDSLARLVLSERSKSADARRHTCRVVMVNDDEIFGDLVQLRPVDGKGMMLVLNTWYAGRLEIPVKMVRSISPGATGSRVVYAGPDNANGWVTGNSSSGDLPQQQQLGGRAMPFNGPVPANPADAVAKVAGQVPSTRSVGWRYSKGAFHSQGSGAMIGRNFDLPDKAQIEFDVHWSGYFSIGLNMYTDKFNQYSGNSYQLRLDRSNASLYRTSPKRGSENMGSNGRSGLGTSQSKARISIYVDKAKKEISLLINGRLIKTWRELAGREFNGKGRGLMFVTRNSTPVRVSGIQIAGWDGNLPKGNNVPAVDGKADFVEFINQDSLSGQVLSLKRGRLEIDAGFGDPVEVALERVGRIDLKSRGGSVPEMPVRALFRDRGRLSFTLGEWAGGQVKLNSPIFGVVTMDESIFSTLEFNLGKPRNEDDN
jgi:hypothetical protein